MAIAYATLAAESASADAALELALQQHRAALVTLTIGQQRAVRDFHLHALRFFALRPECKLRCQSTLQLCSVGPAPVLNGYRRPSDAKELLRLFSNASVGKRVMPAALRRAAARVAEVLDDLLVCCLRSVCRRAGRPVSRRAVRRLVRGNRVLDAFLYHNRQAGLENCAPHIDRGFLHAIVASPVDGLELRRADGSWHAPHDDQVFGPAVAAFEHVIVLVNDALSQLSASWEASELGASAAAVRTTLQPCTHRVIRPTSGAVPRLSISYELRPAADADDAAWEAIR